MSFTTLETEATPVMTEYPTGMPAKGQLAVKTYGLTHPGRKRPSNEDQFVIAEMSKAMRILQSSLPQPQTQYSDERGYLFVVADGMGGHQAGEKASALAIGTIEDFTLNTFKWFFHLKGPEASDVLAEFQDALRYADIRVCQKGAERPELQGMGTTLTMAYVNESRLFAVHAGDSRCYLLRDGKLHQVTQDHTVVGEMVKQGLLSQEEAAHHQMRHVITNAVGGKEVGVRVEVHKMELQAGDKMLLCSDGLTDMLSDQRIAEILHGDVEPKSICERLVTEANEQGGVDNITVVIARFDPPPKNA